MKSLKPQSLWNIRWKTAGKQKVTIPIFMWKLSYTLSSRVSGHLMPLPGKQRNAYDTFSSPRSEFDRHFSYLTFYILFVKVFSQLRVCDCSEYPPSTEDERNRWKALSVSTPWGVSIKKLEIAKVTARRTVMSSKQKQSQAYQSGKNPRVKTDIHNY